MHRLYDIDFAVSKVLLTDKDIEFGIRYGLVATHNSLRLTHLFPDENLPTDWSEAHEKWRLVALIWATENFGDNSRALFDEVDTIWSYFNEPKDMNHLVSFLPTDDPSASYEALRREIRDFIAYRRSIFEI